MLEHAVIGLAGTALTDEERAMLRARAPQGIILFRRNAASPAQVQALVEDARDAAGEYLWVAIDEEGGRVHRLPWPPFSERPPAAHYGARYREDPGRALAEARADAERAGEALAALGVTHVCAPVLDLARPGAHPVIGDRSYGADAEAVARLGAAVAMGFMEAGVCAVAKHFPGHGRAREDSHATTPEVGAPFPELEEDLAPFAAVLGTGAAGHVMTAHVRYTRVDAEPATFSELWLRGVLRERIGFAGMVWSDDLGMRGAGLPVAAGAAKALRAGCDVLLVCEPADVRALFEACAG